MYFDWIDCNVFCPQFLCSWFEWRGFSVKHLLSYGFVVRDERWGQPVRHGIDSGYECIAVMHSKHSLFNDKTLSQSLPFF